MDSIGWRLIRVGVALLVVITTAASQQCARYETYNVGQLSAVRDAEARKPRIIQALRTSTADFICLQEVWMEEDLCDFLEGLNDVFPHHYSAIHAAKDVLRKPFYNWFSFLTLKDTACSVWETIQLTVPLVVCATTKGCLSKTGLAQGECLARECKSTLSSRSIRPSCVSCIFLNALHSLNEGLKTCTIPGFSSNRFNSPGLLVLSKSDLSEVQYTSYFPNNRMAIERGYIKAKTQQGLLNLCTHLSSNINGYVEYDLNFGSYKAQQAEEIRVLNRTFGSQSHILLGDLNTGPSGMGNSDSEKNLLGEFVQNYDTLLNLGYSSPYADVDGRCTFCSNNPLTDNYPNQILDHVMLKGSFSSSEVERLYDQSYPPLSDHYGVGLKVCC